MQAIHHPDVFAPLRAVIGLLVYANQVTAARMILRLPSTAPIRHDELMVKDDKPSVTRKAKRLRTGLATVVAGIAQRVARAQARLRPADIKRKAVGDFVTSIDLRSEAQLRRALAKLLPEAGFLGEESDPTALQSEWLWVVDPIDGTSNYARGLPQFAVSVALLHCGQPVAAAMHCAPEDAIFTAIHTVGAWRNNRPLTAPLGRFDDGAMLGCQWFRGHQDMGFLSRLQSKGARIRTLGSTVVQLADVVMGRLDGNVQQQGRLWDFAAAGLVATEAGLRFTDWQGNAVFPVRDLRREHTSTVTASPAVHRKLLGLLKPYTR